MKRAIITGLALSVVLRKKSMRRVIGVCLAFLALSIVAAQAHARTHRHHRRAHIARTYFPAPWGQCHSDAFKPVVVSGLDYSYHGSTTCDTGGGRGSSSTCIDNGVQVQRNINGTWTYVNGTVLSSGWVSSNAFPFGVDDGSEFTAVHGGQYRTVSLDAVWDCIQGDAVTGNSDTSGVTTVP